MNAFVYPTIIVMLLSTMMLSRSVVAQSTELSLNPEFSVFDHHDYPGILLLAKEDSAKGVLAQAALLSLLRDDYAAEKALNHILTTSNDPEITSRARRSLSGVYVRLGEYEKAANAMQINIAQEQETGVTALTETADFFTQLSYVQTTMQVKVQDLDSVPIQRDKASLLRIEVNINEQADWAVIDTGAAISTMTLSQARKMNLQMISAKTSVQGATRKTVDVGLALAKNISIGNANFTNVPFIIVPDSSLNFKEFNYRISSIIGLPILYAMEKISIQNTPTNPKLVFGGDIKTPVNNTAQMITFAWELEVLGSFNNEHKDSARFFLDTGAQQSSLYQLSVEQNPEITKNSQLSKLKKGGVGEVVIQNRIIIPELRFLLGTQQISSRSIPLEPNIGFLDMALLAKIFFNNLMRLSWILKRCVYR